MQRLYLFLLDWHLAADKPLPAWLARACQKDSVLLSHYNQGLQLSHRLAAFSASPVQSSPRLAAKIHRALDAETSAPARRASRPSPFAVLIPLASGAALALFLVLHQPSPAPTTASDSADALALLQQTPRLLAQSLPLDSLRTDTLSLRPLRQESQALRADALAALHFLARNFLPDSRALNLAPGEQQSEESDEQRI